MGIPFNEFQDRILHPHTLRNPNDEHKKRVWVPGTVYVVDPDATRKSYVARDLIAWMVTPVRTQGILSAVITLT